MTGPHPSAHPTRGRELVSLAAACGVIAVLVVVFARWLGVTNGAVVSLSFLVVVALAAAESTLRVAVGTSLAAAACFNYFFLPPVGTWTIADPGNWFALGAFVVVAILVSRLSAQARARAGEATERRDELTRLFDLTRDILLTGATADAPATIARQIARRFGLSRVAIFRSGQDGWTMHASSDEGLAIDGRELDAALARASTRLEFDAHERRYAGGGESRTADGSRAWIEPMRVGTRPIGLLAFADERLDPGTRDAIAGITAIALERLALLAEREETELMRRGAELRSTLLSALSHDLRTPLTAVTVAAGNLHVAGLSETDRRAQTAIVQAEVARLNRLFDNIVQMARIETRALTAEPEWVQPSEIVEEAIRQVGPEAGRHPIVRDLDEDVAARVDPRLTSAALAHLVENAAQYSPTDAPIEVCATLEAGELRIAVRDRGAGIAPAELPRIFERFYRGTSAGQRFGTGMGLAITRGLLAAEGGRVWAENHPEGGAVFTMAVPAEVRALAEEGAEPS